VLLLKTAQFGLKYGLTTGDWSALQNTMSQENVYVDTVLNAEPFVVQNTLNEVVKTDFRVGPEQLESLVAILVPFGIELGLPSKGFNDFFQPALFSDVDYGLAANIWAQAYSLGSIGIVAVFCVFFVVGIALLNSAYAQSTGSSLAALALAGGYFCFYIHRNDLLYELLLLRRVLIMFVIGRLLGHSALWDRTNRRRRAVAGFASH
jgi:hypothetical protein